MAGKKRYELTPEHCEQLKPWADKWIANAMSTKPMDDADRAAMRVAVKGLYEAAALKPPPDHRIVFVPSPFVLRFAGGFAAGIWHRRRTMGVTEDSAHAAADGATEAATRAATRAATNEATEIAAHEATVDATRMATEPATEDTTESETRAATARKTFSVTRAATEPATSSATIDAKDVGTVAVTSDTTRDATEAATSIANMRDANNRTRRETSRETWDAIRGASMDLMGNAVWVATYEAPKTAPNTNRYWWSGIGNMRAVARLFGDEKFLMSCAESSYRLETGGNQNSDWVAYLSFFRHVAKLKLPQYEKFQHYENAAIHGGPRIMHAEFCMISDRPEILTVDEQIRPHNDTGPFCRWRDGTALYSIHGVRVPAYVSVVRIFETSWGF